MAKKFFSKALSVGLALALCLSLLPMSAFAAEVKKNECEYYQGKHQYTIFVKCAYAVSPVCTVAHSDIYKCMCGAEKTILGCLHDHVLEGTNNVNFGEYDKYCGQVCTVCNLEFNIGEHKFADATCTAPKTCEKCNYVKPGDKELGHNLTRHEAVPATCTAPGTIEYWSCDRCNKNFSDAAGTTEVTELTTTAKGHDYSGIYVKGTTGTGGAGHARLCMNGCGGHSQVVPHVWNDGVETTPATETTAGVKTFTCNDCGATKTEPIPAKGSGSEICNHDFQVKSTTPATCETGSITVEKCSECGYTRTIVGKKLGHDFQFAETTKAATCTEGGEELYQCSRCEETETRPTTANGHDFANSTVYTDLEDGTHAKKCANCDMVQATSIAAHTWDDGVVTTEATETEDGERTYTCTAEGCDATRTESIPATGNQGGDNNQGGGTEIDDADIPLGGGEDLPEEAEEVEIDDVDVPLGGLMTRAEFVNYLWVQASQPEAEASTFADVEDHLYFEAISWAQANGIAKGVADDLFDPDNLVTVEQARLFLERYALYAGIEMPELISLLNREQSAILDNADEVLGEFFGLDQSEAEDDAA